MNPEVLLLLIPISPPFLSVCNILIESIMKIVLAVLLVTIANASADDKNVAFDLQLPVGLTTGLNNAREGANQAGVEAHNQLINFGKLQSSNIDYFGKAVQNLWKDFHDLFHGHAGNAHKGMIAFGHTVERVLARFSPVIAGLWAGFQNVTDTSINNGNQRLIEMGGNINNNMQNVREQAVASWNLTQSLVDGPLHQGLGTWSTPRPARVSHNGLGNAGNVHVSVGHSTTRSPPHSENLLIVEE
jgi:hypothetical protein